MVKVGLISDAHDPTPNLQKYREAFDTYKREHVDEVVINGDFFNQDRTMALCHRISEQTNEETMERFGSTLGAQEYEIASIGLEVMSNGGPQGLQNAAINALMTGHEKQANAIIELLTKYMQNQEQIDDVFSREETKEIFEYGNRLQKVRLDWQYENEFKPKEEFRYAILDNMCGELQAQGIAVKYVMGNHDWMLYDFKNAQRIDVGGAVNIGKGADSIRVVGVQNWYEQLGTLPNEWYAWRDNDPAFGGDAQSLGGEVDAIIAQDPRISDQERQEWKNGAFDGKIPQGFLIQNPVYNRLKNESFDWIITHKGFGRGAKEMRDGKEKRYGSGIGLEAIVRERVANKTLKGQLFGHIHGPGHIGRESEHGRTDQYVHTTDRWYAVLDLDGKTKEVKQNGAQWFKFKLKEG